MFKEIILLLRMFVGKYLFFLTLWVLGKGNIDLIIDTFTKLQLKKHI